MSYGLELKNTSGNTIIDSTYKNMLLWETGTWQVEAEDDYSGYTTHDLSNPVPVDTPPMIGLRPYDGGVNTNVCTLGKSDDDNYYDRVVTGTWTKRDYSKKEPVDYAVFVEASPSFTKDKYGLVVYDDANNIVYSSDHKGCKMIDQWLFDHPFKTQPDPDAGGTTFKSVNVTDADNNYFILSPPTGCASDSSADDNPYFMPTIKYVDKHTIDIYIVTSSFGLGYVPQFDYITLIELSL